MASTESVESTSAPERRTDDGAPPARAVTMQDVARAAGVSVQTVSNVVNGNRARVGRETQQRVTDVIEELGYRVNVPARQLRRGRTGRIGFAVPDLDDPYYGALAQRLADHFEGHGFRLVVHRTGGQVAGEVAALATSSLDGYDGLVLAVSRSESVDLDRRAASAPVVLIGERALSHPFDHVVMDNVRGARLGTDHLLTTGSRRIALLGGDPAGGESMPGLRTAGYLDAHRERGVEVDPALLVPWQFTLEQGFAATTRLLAEGRDVDGVVAMTDTAALGALRALADAGLRVPDDVQVVGWDALELGSYAVPSLSTVDPDTAAMAGHICTLLLDRLSGLAAGGPGQLVVPPARLVLRESTR